jgi:prephenate dehydrogenase
VTPRRLVIIGVGLLGGSIGLAVKSAGIGCRVIGYGHRRSTLDHALELGAIDEAFDSPEKSVEGADWIILCTPVGLFESLLKQIAPALTHDVIITDVGSTKRSVVRAAQAILPSSAHFVGSHPMAGSEKRGVEFARPDLFRGARCILTPTTQTDPTALQSVDDFWQRLGMNTLRLSPEDHDRLVCDISHLPHVVASALIAMQSDEALPLAGMGFLDTTRVAGGDGALWRDILRDNRDNLAASIHRLRSQLDELLQMLDRDQRDQRDPLARWLTAAAERRAKLLAAKLNEIHGE